MLKKIRIEESGDTEYLPGTMVDVLDYEDLNEALIAAGDVYKRQSPYRLQLRNSSDLPSCLISWIRTTRWAS